MSFNIRQIRKEQKISLSTLSKLSGISKSYLSDLENGKDANPTIQTLQKIAAALNTSLTSLIIEKL